ncbi:aminotransferase class I/II-fold pyridoxal phosphate-dependent enzyme [Actinoplanes sp. NPDC051494]|uniref:aminotransferase class I/II-fold pyridoxal phosphate-dependent enzyme n=1 Tax=Actinoplanes sp. NPDC051494 TaxID=3363907 RepID=UPI003799A0F0
MQTGYLYFVERAVHGMRDIVAGLGDELAVRRPDVPGANTPYGLLTHCLGVLDYWGGHVVAGRTVERDRDAEFDAVGPVAELCTRADRALEQLRADIAGVDWAAAPRNEPDPAFLGPSRRLDQGGVLLHLFEEMAQHHGQMEVVRDLLRIRDFDDVPLSWLRAKRGVKWQRPGPDLLPAWVAETDFPVAPPVRDALHATIARGDLGYPDGPGYPPAAPFAARMRQRYGWEPDPAHVRPLTDLIQSLQLVLTLATAPGDGVVAFTPNYPPFLATIASMGRRLVSAPAVARGESWTWDLDRLDADLRAAGARVLLLVNPHNPTGRMYSRAELTRIAELADRHDLLVVSDEIHAELAHAPRRHVPFASLGPSAAARTVTVTSAAKAFNIAGLRTAVAHVGPEELRARWDAQPPDLHGKVNVLGVEATLAAWASGDPWLRTLNGHLLRQRDHLVSRMADLPGLRLRAPDAGYLAWIDCTAADLPESPVDWFRRHAGVELSAGADFGPGHEAFVRLNFATTTAVLDRILDAMAAALSDRSGTH